MRTTWLVDIGWVLVAAALALSAPLSVAGQEHKGTAATICIGVGDVVQVSIFEASAGGRSGNSVTLPSQTVDIKGTFPVPFAGNIDAAGRPLSEIEREIEARLASRVIAPGVKVALVAQETTSPCR